VDGVKYHSACAGFVERLEEENILSIVSNLALDEVWYALLRVNLINDFEREWHNKLRNEPEIINKYVPLLRRTTADILMLSNVIVVEIPTEATLKALDAIERYHLLQEMRFIYPLLFLWVSTTSLQQIQILIELMELMFIHAILRLLECWTTENTGGCRKSPTQQETKGG
jgi:hypothetical protein